MLDTLLSLILAFNIIRSLLFVFGKSEEHNLNVVYVWIPPKYLPRARGSIPNLPTDKLLLNEILLLLLLPLLLSADLEPFEPYI